MGKNNLFHLKQQFKKSKIAKPSYISKMHRFHKMLFDYSKFIKSTNVSKIEIDDGGVVMTLRDTGIKIVCDSEDERIAPLEMLNFDEYERDEIDMAARMVKKGFNVLDIGANIGWWSLTLTRLKPDLKICAFEPVPKTYGYLKENIKINNITNITALNLGLSDKKGSFTFYYYPEGSGNASLKNVSKNKRAKKIICPVTTLDEYVKKTKIKIDFIKCDVEGGEMGVLKGALKTLRRDRPIIFIEMLRKWSAPFNYHPNDIIKFLKNIGYQCYTINGKKLKKFLTMTDRTIDTNFVFQTENRGGFI